MESSGVLGKRPFPTQHTYRAKLRLPVGGGGGQCFYFHARQHRQLQSSRSDPIILDSSIARLALLPHHYPAAEYPVLQTWELRYRKE